MNPLSWFTRPIDRWVDRALERETRPLDWTNTLALVVLMVVMLGPALAAGFFPDRYRGWFDLPAYLLAGAGIVHLSGFHRRRAYHRGLRDGALQAIDFIEGQLKQGPRQ